MAVYFIGDSEAARVKVGIAKDVRRRLSQLQVGCPVELELIGHVEGPEDSFIEWQAHKLLKAVGSHIRGEWFAGPPTLWFLLSCLWRPQRRPRFHGEVLLSWEVSRIAAVALTLPVEWRVGCSADRAWGQQNLRNLAVGKAA